MRDFHRGIFVSLTTEHKSYVMRKYLLTFGMLALLLSCDNDDDNISIDNREEALFGQWEYEAIRSNTAVDINGDGTVNVDCESNTSLNCASCDDFYHLESRCSVGMRV